MATESIAHPAKDQLIAFGQGKLAADESSQVEQHLEVCRECCETLLDLKDDTFVGLVKIATLDDADRRMDAPVRPAGASSNTEADKVGTGNPPKSDHPTEAATVLVQSGEAIGSEELPAELVDHPRYRIVELIGRGGMGNVYRAEHRLMNRPVAIKLINSQLIRQPNAVERFRREVQAAAKLTHPNIVTAYDAEQAGDVHFLVMEFVEGTDLASVVKHRGPMSVAEACDCIRQAAEGLQHAHEKGMVHRDIKPHNLMLASGGQVRILDFGLAGFVTEAALGQTECNPKRQRGAVAQDGSVTAKIEETSEAFPVADSLADASGYMAAAAHLTTAGSVMGTPDYIAPEQAKDAHSADIRADIYSLGCTLHFLLTGKPPFEADNIVGKLKAHASEPPSSLSSLRKDVPAELSRVAARMLAKDPADRFQTPAEVVAALQACEKLVQPSARTRRFHWRRFAKVVGLVMAGFVLLAGVIVLSTNRGWLEIRSHVDDLKVTVRNNGEQVEFSDLKTGSHVKWISGGKCDLEIVGNRNDVKLDQNSVTVSRFGHVIVTATWNVAGLDLIRSFAPTDKTISQDGVTSEAGGWKVTASSDRTAQLFDVSDPPLRDGGVYFCVAKLKSENVVGKAYLDMHSLIPRRMNAFIGAGVDRAISGTNDWQTIEVPMFLQPGEKPNAIKINVSIVGSGTVWIKDIELRGKQRPAGESDQDHLQGRWIAKTIKAGNGAMPAGAVSQWTMTFNGQALQVTSPTGRNEGTFKLDVSKEPKEIDVEPAAGEGLIRGIYRFVGDELEVCLEDSNRKRPIQWDVDVGTRQMLIRLQRDPAKSTGKRPSAPNQFERDQQAAEWIARIGATQRVNLGGVEKHVAKRDELPDGDWQITEISLYPLRFDTSPKLDKISGLHALRWMRLFGCQATDDAVKQMTDLPNLKFIDLDQNPAVTDESLMHIATNYPAMESVSLWATGITDQGLRSLSALKKLQILSVSGTKINGSGLAHFAEHPTLREIHLGRMKITDEMLRQLPKIPQLDLLVMVHTTLSDEAADAIAKLSKLKHLDIRDTAISAASLEKLRSALPNCEILAASTNQEREQFERETGHLNWTRLETTKLMATNGTTLRRLDDGSIVAEGVNPAQSIYTINAKTSLKQVTALRLDVLLDDSLPSRGPGRKDDGTFVLTGFEVRFQPAAGAPEKLMPLRRAIADYSQFGSEAPSLLKSQGSWAIWRDGAALQNQSLVVELDETLAIKEDSTLTITLKQESAWAGCNLGRFRLSVAEPPQQPVKTVGQNLITDPSFENTGLTQLPRDWRAWLNDGPDFRCEVVAGGHTGQRCLRISGKGTRGVVFGNELKADRSKRYALKGWVKFEGDKGARALIKLNYFRGGEFLGVHDLVGATADQPGWQLFEKTDTLDAFPTADHFYPMCHVEGSGTGWFDDLELIAYDRDKLPNDFDARHGRHNRLHGPNSLHRWVGTWDTEYVFRETDNSPTETKLSMTTTSERTLGDYFLLSHAKAVPVAPKDRKPTPADPPANAAALGGEERVLFLTFDQDLGAFRQWLFSSNGKAFEWRGPWDNAKQSLELRMLPDASNLFSNEHFVDGDHIEAKLWFQYVMGQRDAGRWTATRKAFDGKVDAPIAKTHVAEPAELSQLNKFAGEWTIRAKYKPSVWNPQPREETIRETSVWILGGRFLMTRTFNEKDELTSIWIATYEPREKSNRFWFYNADGSSGEWRLTWDEALRGFQFRSVDLPNDWSGTGFNRWVNEDTFDNQALIKDEQGRVLLDSTQDRRRKK